MQKIQQDLLKVEATVKELQSQIEAMKKRVEPSGVWKPERGERYVYMAADQQVQETTFDSDFDRRAIEIGLAFPTKEAAELHVKKLKVIQKLKGLAGGRKPDWKNVSQNKYILIYRHNENAWSAEVGPYYQYGFILPYFETRELAQAAITTLGDELNVLLEG